MQGTFNLSHFVDVALLLRTVKIRKQTPRSLVLAVRDFSCSDLGRLALSLLVSVKTGAQIQPTIGQKISQSFQLSLCGDRHHGGVQYGVGRRAIHDRFWKVGQRKRLIDVNGFTLDARRL